jgi:hypothetical protein
MNMKIQMPKYIYYFYVLIFLAGCTPFISSYNPVAYENATSLKATALVLMDKANEPYSSRQKEIDQLLLNVEKAYEFSKGLEYNDLSTKQWEILKKADGDLLGKFMNRWQQAGSKGLSPVYIKEFRSIISDAFDEIICLEANKEKPQKCSGSRS